jgi:bacterioferritin (cytochrome b1)
VDARLHHLQRETEFVTSQAAALALVEEFHREKLAAMIQHMSHARLVDQYDANNTYQYIVNRDDVQLSWLAKAITELGGAEPAPTATPTESIASGPASVHALFDQDARAAQAMVERWRPRVEAMTNARNQKMLQVILGETIEQQRFFEQARAGRTDLLGKRGDPSGPAQGAVLGDRWIE